MMVTSLLNSGADIQALNKVGQHLSLYILVAIGCNKIYFKAWSLSDYFDMIMELLYVSWGSRLIYMSII